MQWNTLILPKPGRPDDPPYGSAATPAEGYRAAFALAGGLMLTFGILALVFTTNQQRDRRRLGLDTTVVLTPGAPTPIDTAPTAEAKAEDLDARTRA